MPGTRHAKNNTALGFFTKHEREGLDWGTKKVRLGKDSIKKFDACTICLKICVHPMICPRGDLFCQECIYESLLSQKQNLKDEKFEIETMKIEKEQMQEEFERKNAIDQFIKFDKLETSLVLDNINRNEENSKLFQKESQTKTKTNNSNNADKAKIALEEENAHDKELGCFWIPQMTPNMKKNEKNQKYKRRNDLNVEKPHKKSCYCPGCNQTLKLKNLIRVKFTLAVQDSNDYNKSKLKSKTKNKRSKKKESNDGSILFRSGLGATIQTVSSQDEKRFVCPCCNEILTNAMKIACLKHCGHVICLKCVTKFVAQSKSCTVCNEPCRKKKDIILLALGGTGYSAHGNQMQSVKKDVAFQ